MLKFIFIAAILTFLICLWLASAIRVEGADEINALIPFIIKVESNGNPNAVGTSGEIGLLQISSIVLEEFNREHKIYRYTTPSGKKGITHLPGREWETYKLAELFNHEVNIRVGTWYLRRLKDHYIPKNKYSVEVLLASYNCGPTKMRKLGWDWKKAPKSTVRYVKKVMALYKEK